MRKQTKELLRENNELCRELSDEGNAVLTDMVVYLRGCDISMYDQERVRRDITQMLIDGERRGDPAGNVIGDDYRVFCDSVVSEIPRRSRAEKAWGLVNEVFLTAVVLIAIWWIGGTIEILLYHFLGRSVDLYLPITLGNVLGGVVFILAAEWLFIYLAKHAFQKDGNKKWFAVFLLAVLIGLCLNMGLNRIVFRIHFLPALAVILIIFAISRTLSSRVD